MSILTGMEMDIFTPSFPEIIDVFSVNIEQVQLTLSLNFIAYALSTLWIGPLAERFNHKSISILSLCIFTTGSILCYTTNSFELLLVGRVLQGLGMSGPNVLAYSIVYDFYPRSREHYMAILTGLSSVTMGVAPVLGSYLNLWFGWRTNFLSLLILSLLCLVLGMLYLPSKKIINQAKPKLTLNTYLPLFKSPVFQKSAALGLSISVSYFIFVGFAPILYREDLHVSLESFGMYQGALSSAFGIMCFCSNMLYKWFGRKRCFKVSINFYAFFGLLAAFYGFFSATNPLVLTIILVGSSIACAVPINISYPISLGAIPNASARASGLLAALRLVFCAIGLQVMACFYNHSFLPLAIMIGLEGLLAWCLGKRIYNHAFFQKF